MPWPTPFNDPVLVPKGGPLITLRDAANYIIKLPKVEHDTPEWQAAMEALILVAERNGPTTLARIGVMRALRTVTSRVFTPSRKEKRWGKRKLKRDE